MNDGTDIAFFIPSTTGGGAERVITTVAETLQHRGYTVDLVLGEVSASEVTVEEDVSVIGFNKSRISQCVIPLMKYLRRVNPTVIVSTIYICNIIVATSHMLARSDSRLILRVANTPSVHLSSKAPRHVFARSVLPMVYQRADALIAISEGVRDDLIDHFGVSLDAVTVVYNPIDLSIVDSKMSEEISHVWLQSEATQTVLAVGRLTKQKDYPTLLRAFKLVVESNPSARLIILGDGELRDELKQFAQDIGITHKVRFEGYVSNPYQYLARADLFVLSSAWEGFGSVILEALACRCPVVSTDCPSGPREILSDGRYGELTPVGSPAELATAITQSLKTSHNTVALRSRAEEFAVESIVDSYEQVLYAGLTDSVVSK